MNITKKVKKMELRKKKYLGQNFLNDHNILRKEVALAEVEGKSVLEIGGGDGRLTEKILDAAPSKLYVVEKDPRFSEILRSRFQNAEIINQDFLETDLEKLKPEIIIGNIPYNISSKIIFSIAKYKFHKAVLMVQKEFAEKMCAKPNEHNYGRLSVTSQLFFNVSYIQTIPRHLFSPAPKVDSGLIVLTPTINEISSFTEEIINKLFQHRNKTVKNSLSGMDLSRAEEYTKRRVRTLSKEECLDISKLLNKEKN